MKLPLVKTLAIIGVLATLHAEPLVYWPSNGHYYRVVSVPGGISWASANSAAIAAGGYLATVTNAAENAFVFSLVDNATYWNGAVGPHLGGQQAAMSSEPAGGWGWVTGETWSYTDWDPASPNDTYIDGSHEDKLHYYSGTGSRGMTWNDIPSWYTGVKAYIIEWDSIPCPTNQWTVGSGGNGHYYQAVYVPDGITWSDASTLATGEGGYLATLTSLNENTFVYNLISTGTFWNGGVGPHIGGQQAAMSTEPAGGWGWVTAETWSYTDWDSTAPNDYFIDGSHEDKLHYYSDSGSPDKTWNDIPSWYGDDGHVKGLVIEWSSNPCN
jgi:hypothetical protein